MTPSSDVWTEFRCKSPSCTTPGGRVLYRAGVDGLVSVRRRRCGVIVVGVPVALFCDCGWAWRNATLSNALAVAGDMPDCQEG